MSEKPIKSEGKTLKTLAVEGKLPLKPVGIENLKEANPKHLPPHRYLHPWFARRPTPASRLAILASVLPKETDPDDLLRWMQIGPQRDLDVSRSEYVEQKKATENDRSGNLEEHYGYPRPFTSSPSKPELDRLHKILENQWNGELPTVLDPTAGGGVIPFESLRYGFPTKANELNQVPSIILKVMLEYAPKVGSIESDIKKWGDTINEKAKENLEPYFPSVGSNCTPDNYITSYSIKCSSCGVNVPLVNKWWIRTRRSADKVTVKPELEDSGSINYNVLIDPKPDELDDFDPGEGPVSRGGNVECLNCGVVTENDTVKEKFKKEEFEYEILCVRTIDRNDNYSFRSPVQEDQDAFIKAKEKIESDYELSTFLNGEIPPGFNTDQPQRHGITHWRDLFCPRQLISHYEFLESVNKTKPEIYAAHDEDTANAILSVITLACGKLVDRNSRLADWDTNKGYPNPMFKSNNLSFKGIFTDNNISVGGMDFLSQLEKVTNSYENIVSYIPKDAEPADVTTADAASLPYEDEEIQAVVNDPPYYSSIMYSELADVFYVWMREYLGDIFPDLFNPELTSKEEEAVANPSRFRDIAGDSASKEELANDFYEQNMSDIFSEIYRVLEPGGVMTIMFTHKETAAWDTLTMSLINSGFIITSTHPITSEMPQRAGVRKKASADSTLLLTGRKPHEDRDPENAVPSLWSDVKSDTRTAAKEAARDLIDSGLSLTKTDVIISAFGPTLRVFADAYPVVDDEDNEVPPRRALEEAREAVTQVLVDEYLEAEGIDELDDVTEWYILCWLVHESETFSYDEGHQLGLGIGVDIDEIKRSTKTWRKSRGDISLRGHDGRVQNINEKPEDRSSRIPVNPDDLSFSLALDKVHAAMHVYDVQGESACCDWLRERNFDTDSTFKSTLKALLQVLPHDHEDWELARDLAAGRTRDVLDLDFSPNVFADDGDETQQSELDGF